MSTLSMYETLMGANFLRLSPPVRAFHQLRGRHVLQGRVQTEEPRTFLARLLARGLGTPLAATNGAIRFELEASDNHEVWIRHFPKDLMMSRMCLVHGQLTERLGLARLHFRLEEVEGRLVMRLTRLKFLGIPCPRWAMPTIIAEEHGEEDRIHFNIRATLPLIGQVTGYQGYLVVGPSAG